VSEHIPRIAQQAHRFALIRSVTHPDQTHTIAMHYMLTGHRHPQPSTNPQNQPTDFPTFGAVMQHLRPSPGVLPSGISLNSPANQLSANNHIFPGFFAGFLGQRCDPLFVSENPSAAEFQPFRGAEGWPAARLSNAEGLRRELTRHRQALDAAGATRSFDAFHERAYSLIASPEAQAAFNLSREPQHLRDRYGRTPFGQGLLLARRLVEAGVCLTTVNWSRDYEVQPGDMFFWDTHARNFPLLKDKLLPVFDQGFSALLEDLDERGLLHQTLVVCLGEFGRTPKISSNGGREHWPGCHSVVLAGAGIRGGQVYGASDKIAAWPDSDPVSPEDLAATIYHALGVDLQTELRDHLGRPRYLCEGKPLLALFG
jgi:hypothetical protein